MLLHGPQATPWLSLTCNEGMRHAPSRLPSSLATDLHWSCSRGFVSVPRGTCCRASSRREQARLSAAHSYSGGHLISGSRTDEEAHPDAAPSGLKRRAILNLAVDRRAFALGHQKAQCVHDCSLPARNSDTALGAHGPSGTEAPETLFSEITTSKIR